MTLDANKYRLRIPYIISLTKDKTAEEIYDFISVLAIATGIPIIIVACYVGEIYGFNDKLSSFIERLKAFYSIKEVYNVKK